MATSDYFKHGIGDHIKDASEHLDESLLEEFKRRQDVVRQAEVLANIGLFVYDEKQEHYLFMSEGFAAIHGLAPQEYVNKIECFDDDLSLIHEADREQAAAAYRRYRETGENMTIEYRIVRENGEIRWMREFNQARKLQDGSVNETLGVAQDITDEKTNELDLIFKDNLASQVEQITDIGYYIFDDLEDRYSFVSNGYAQIHGVSVDYLMNNVLSTGDDQEFCHEEDRERVAEAYAAPFVVDDEGYNTLTLEYRLIKRNGEIRWVREICRTHVIEEGVNQQTTGVLIDITEQKEAEREILKAKEVLEETVAQRTLELAETVKALEKEVAERKKIASEMEFLANHDALTGLPSLRLGIDRLEQAIRDARRSNGPVVVMFLDLDGFKRVNDNFGHKAGDLVLKTVAERVRSEVREQDTVARIGGDEFMVILRGMDDLGVIEKLAINLIQRLHESVNMGGQSFSVGVSIGISIYPRHGGTAEALIKSADNAMYQVKRRGKNDFRIAES